MLWALIRAAFCRNGIIVNFSKQGARHQQIGGEEFGGGGWMDWGTSRRGLWIAHTIAISLTLPQLHFFIGQSLINYNATQSLSRFSHFWSANNFLPQGSGLEFSRDRQELTCQLWPFFSIILLAADYKLLWKKVSAADWKCRSRSCKLLKMICCSYAMSSKRPSVSWGVWIRLKQSVFLMPPCLNPRCLSQYIHWLQEKHEFRWCLGTLEPTWARLKFAVC